MLIPETIVGDLAATLLFGLVAIVLALLGYKGFDRLTPGVSFDAELAKGNIAVAIVISAFMLGLCWVIVSVVTAIVS